MKIKHLILASAIVFLATFYFGWHLGREKGKTTLEMERLLLNNEISTYITKIGDDSVYIAQKEQVIITQREAIKRGLVEREELRKLNIKHLNEISRLKLQIDTLLTDVSNDGIVVVIHDTISVTPHNAILLPFNFSKKDNYLDLSGNFNSQGKLDISLKMDVPIDLWMTVQKKSKEPTVLLTSKNSYIKALSISSLKFDSPKPKKYNISLVVGYGLTKNLETSPFIGVALGRSIIRF